MAVLKKGPNRSDLMRSLMQLEEWVDHYEEIGVELAEFESGATGFQALITGSKIYAFVALGKEGS